METKLIAPLVAGAALLGALAFAQTPKPAPAPQPAPLPQAKGSDTAKDAAASELEALRMKQDALTLELVQTRAALERVVAYIAQQSQAAKAMEATLAESERKGFAVGENFDSRRVLLAGWREQLSAMQQGLPEVVVVKEADTKKPAGN